ncbi:MAG: aspartyl protease family protein [Sulfurovaceae bacterium]|nr:aspartyl protease family protein [Sulfurovaceae bacterium]
MFQIVLSLMVGVFIGWNFHLFYISLEPKSLIPQSLALSQNYKLEPMEEVKLKEEELPKLIVVSKENNLSEKNISTIPEKFLNLKLVDKRIVSEEVESKTHKSSIKNAYFQVLLKQNKFTDAMAFYMEGEEVELKAYRLILKVYFYDKSAISAEETIGQILQYIEIEPLNLDIQLYLAKLYLEQNEFEKSINFLFELQNNYQDKNLQLITTNLDTTIESYITKLNDAKSTSKLIVFLEDIISKSITPEKYIIRLAELYKNLEIYDKAEELLSEINNDSTYSNKAINLLNEIEKSQIETEQYPYKIPLNKIGSHFTVNLNINHTPLTLLLDTGASYTFIDTDKIPNLEGGREILLNTAGGEIIGEFYVAQSLTLQEIELKNFKITVAPFKNQNTDGLLGMNFFEKFDFKIDQERGILYLGNHSRI